MLQSVPGRRSIHAPRGEDSYRFHAVVTGSPSGLLCTVVGRPEHGSPFAEPDRTAPRWLRNLVVDIACGQSRDTAHVTGHVTSHTDAGHVT